MAPTWILVCQIFIFSSNCTCTFSFFVSFTYMFFCFFLSSPPHLSLPYINTLWNIFFSLFFFFFKKKKIKKGRAGNLSPKMFKIRMRWGNKSVRKKLCTLVLLLTYYLSFDDFRYIEKKNYILTVSCFL